MGDAGRNKTVTGMVAQANGGPLRSRPSTGQSSEQIANCIRRKCSTFMVAICNTLNRGHSIARFRIFYPVARLSHPSLACDGRTFYTPRHGYGSFTTNPFSPAMNLADHIRSIPDFPKPGILFYDITPLLANPDAFREAVRGMAEPFRGGGVSSVAAAEARGFVFGGPIALELDVPFIPVRKPGKLPYDVVSHTYALEYGTDTLEMHVDAVQPGDSVLIVDDLLATGGTVEACCQMIERAGGNVAGCTFLIELDFLNGAAKLQKYKIASLLHYDK